MGEGQVTYCVFVVSLTFELPCFFRQHLQKGVQRPMCFPQGAKNRFFEVPTRASEAHGTFPADGDELTGDEPRQFADPENAAGCAVVCHGGPRVNHDGNSRWPRHRGSDRSGPASIDSGRSVAPRGNELYTHWINPDFALKCEPFSSGQWESGKG